MVKRPEKYLRQMWAGKTKQRPKTLTIPSNLTQLPYNIVRKTDTRKKKEERRKKKEERRKKKEDRKRKKKKLFGCLSGLRLLLFYV